MPFFAAADRESQRILGRHFLCASVRNPESAHASEIVHVDNTRWMMKEVSSRWAERFLWWECSNTCTSRSNQNWKAERQFFFVFTPTAEEKWRVNVHPSSTHWWWWSDVQSFAEHFAHQFNGEGDANGRKHCEKSALLSCCAAFAFANEEVFNSLWCRVKLFRSPIMLSLADPGQSKWWVKFLRSRRLAAGCPTCSFISCIGSLSDRWGFAIWTRFHNLAPSSNWSRIAGG